METATTHRTTDPGFLLSRRLDAATERRESRQAWATVLSCGLYTLLARGSK